MACQTLLYPPSTLNHRNTWGKFSPFVPAIALEIPNVWLSDLLTCWHDRPDSDAESTDGNEPHAASSTSPSPSTAPPTATTHPVFLPFPLLSPAIPGSIICVARPGTTPAPPRPGGAIPGSIIHVAQPTLWRLPPVMTSSPADVRARHLAKKYLKDCTARRIDREQRRVNSGCRLKLCVQLHIRRAVPLQLNLNLEQCFHAPVAQSAWQAVLTEELERHMFSVEELLAKDATMRLLEWKGTPTPIVDADV
ncbi:hypothetical protein C8R45DRAFT_1106432 [Mycena sanguinolenta]|nr:hypothetical protein C8R45DRAFT_1106432 [Mycena sanguinolenta]